MTIIRAIYIATLLFAGVVVSSAMNGGGEHRTSSTTWIVRINEMSPEAAALRREQLPLSQEKTEHYFPGSRNLSSLLLPATKKAFYREWYSQNPLLRRRNTHTPEAILENLYTIEIDGSPLQTQKLVQSYRHLPYLQYIEPLPERVLFDTFPNDPRLDEQYYLEAVQAIAAWELLPPGATALIAVVDSGLEYDHEDLIDNLWFNPGEIGFDEDGNDKRFNGIDDDGNGFVDDFQGWDFASGQNPDGGDNDPYPGNGHGTHVAGTAGAVVNNGIGTAGVAKQVQLVGIKIGPDNPNARTVQNQYDGVLYAATLRPAVINCSWGGGSFSQAEQEIIDLAVELGCVVVAAAGNDFRETASYPAAYRGVLSVAALNQSGSRAAYSSYHHTVGIAAPGSGIVAPHPTNTYRSLQGTSMASPIVAAAAAMLRMKYPEYSPLQVIAHLRASSNRWGGDLPVALRGKMGTGSLNILQALSLDELQSAILQNIVVANDEGSSTIVAGEECNITYEGINLLAPVENLSIMLLPASSDEYTLLHVGNSFGALATGEEFTNMGTSPLRFRLSPDIAPNTRLPLRLLLLEGSDTLSIETVEVIANPSYRLFDANNIAVTVTDAGNLGYNDFPDNVQGDGFRYKGGSDILFEGAFMVGASAERLSSAARDGTGNRPYNSFVNTERLVRSPALAFSGLEGDAAFRDGGTVSDLGVSIHKRTRQYDEPGRTDAIIFDMAVVNTRDEVYENMYMGMYYDWDIGPGGRSNIAAYDREASFGYMFNERVEELPYVGMLGWSNRLQVEEHFFAIDNDGDTDDNPGVYDGFTNQEKWLMMSGQIRRHLSNSTDASAVIGVGPYSLAPGDTAFASFAIGAADNLEDLRECINALRVQEDIVVSIQEQPKSASFSAKISPMPITENFARLHLQGAARGQLKVEMYSLLGERLYSNSLPVTGGEAVFGISIPTLSAGIYTFLLTDAEGKKVALQVIIST